MTQSIARQVIELEYKTAADLREIYNSIFPKKCAANASKDFLKPRIAYRLQEVTLGSLDEETVVKMEKVASGLSISNPQLHSDLLPGTKICREWNDVMYEIEVLKDAFEYKGKKFRSLSAIAREITGTRWNGLKFFRIKE